MTREEAQKLYNRFVAGCMLEQEEFDALVDFCVEDCKKHGKDPTGFLDKFDDEQTRNLDRIVPYEERPVIDQKFGMNNILLRAMREKMKKGETE